MHDIIIMSFLFSAAFKISSFNKQYIEFLGGIWRESDGSLNTKSTSSVFQDSRSPSTQCPVPQKKIIEQGFKETKRFKLINWRNLDRQRQRSTALMSLWTISTAHSKLQVSFVIFPTWTFICSIFKIFPVDEITKSKENSIGSLFIYPMKVSRLQKCARFPLFRA